MPITEHYAALARYNLWMNRKLYAVAATLDDGERRRNLGAFFRSVHGTLAHLLLADRAWLGRLAGNAETGASRDASGAEILVGSLDQILYENFLDLRREREATDDAILAWTESIDDHVLERPIRYRNVSGNEYEHPTWWAALHLFNHGTHHRGQATTLLKQLGADPGVTDLAAMLREEQAAAKV